MQISGLAICGNFFADSPPLSDENHEKTRTRRTFIPPHILCVYVLFNSLGMITCVSCQLWFSLLASAGKREGFYVTKCRWLDIVEAMQPTCQFSAALSLLNQCFFVGIMKGF
jgi:hypothetical protein